jgi:hypothetical protein
MANNRVIELHQQWIGYLNPTGLVFSPNALEDAQVVINEGVISDQREFLDLVTKTENEETKFSGYANVKDIFIKNNQKVKQGQLIGLAGKTGLSGTVHIHWTLGRNSNNRTVNKEFKPFFSILAENIELKNKIVKNTFFKEGYLYTSTNKLIKDKL